MASEILYKHYLLDLKFQKILDFFDKINNQWIIH